MNYPEIIAHVRKDKNGRWETQTLEDHLFGVAKLAGDFAEEFGNRDWGELIGFWHDLGKFVPDWQKHIRKSAGYDLDAHVETLGDKVNHSAAGAILAFKKLEKCPPIARVLAYPIAGHHTGLPDWYPGSAKGETLPERLFRDPLDQELETRDIEQIEREPQAREFLNKPIPKSAPMNVEKFFRDKTKENLHLWVRMLFSCLVDADYLDTESFMDQGKSFDRVGYTSLSELKRRFDCFMERKQRDAKDTPINRKRQEILSQCRGKAKLEPGIFTLTVPTGGGKTLSSMAFALEHALSHGKRRVIYAIPYTSIIEQTAKVFKYGTDKDEEIEKLAKSGTPGLFGEENILEHHSNLDPEKEDARSRLATENWDAPIIVTTNVQLFESLFSFKISTCRKLHNIVNSVIILDEAQLLPPEFLKPILSLLKGLVESFGVTIVLCTATQPVLTGRIGTGQTLFEGLDQTTEIIDSGLDDDSFRRVSFHFPKAKDPERVEWIELATELAQIHQVLCIVNTRRDCRELHSLMPEGTLHLSALMCGEERSVRINEIKVKLDRGESLRVISTQLVEAGVDIDFPVVYRAMGGLDSIAQAAGRCNREGRLSGSGKLGRVVVFNPPRPAPPGFLRKGEETCLQILGNGNVETLDGEIFSEYFRSFYGRVNDLDKPRFTDQLVKEAWGEVSPEFKFQFRSFSQNFRMIDDQVQKGVVVFYENPLNNKRSSRLLVEELRKKGPDRKLYRKLQRFTVNLPQREFETIRQAGMVEEIHGLYVQCCDGLYKEGFGLLADKSQWCNEPLIA